MRALFTIIIMLIAGIPLLAQNPGDQVFNEPKIFEVRFHFDQRGFLDSLHKSHETGDYIPGHVTIDGVLYDEVGVRFKGHSSYLFYPGEKKPFRIKFNKYKDHRFDGLKKINLNNGWGDPSLLREKIHLDFLRVQGIPAPRANFARVYIDSVYWGFYSLVEHVDKVFLDTRFGDNDGNLYKAEKSTLEWKGAEQENYYQDMELKTNEKENNWSGFIHFLDVLNHAPESDFAEQLETVFNPESYLKAWAADNLFVNLDSYIGSAANYYLYDFPPDNRFEWIVWDVNLTFAARGGHADLDILYTIPQRPLAARMSLVEKYKNRYLAIMEDYVHHYFTAEEIFPQIDFLAALIRKDYLADINKMYTDEEVTLAINEGTEGVPGLKTFILTRRQNVILQLDSLNDGVNYLLKSEQAVPASILLYPNYPNPFNPVTTITYELNKVETIELSVYDLLGKKVAALVSGRQGAGRYNVKWDANEFSGGIYFYRLSGSSGGTQIRKMILNK